MMMVTFFSVHGDYQETNLFFEDGRVSTIIDWDQAYVAPRAWEVVRTLHYALQLDAICCKTFLEAYRQVLPLNQTELNTAAGAYGLMRGHDLWQYEEVYLHRNERLRMFFQPEERFVPFIEQWQELPHRLDE